ncbi:MAG: DUF512 domain-containing protein, partial [Candidatus Latescibacterota bacterium]
ATDPELRLTMLGRKRSAGNILERIARLAEGGIEMHTQVVLCPGWNDGPQLERTVRELSAFHPAVRSVALVPVGLTRHREKLPELRPVTPELAREYVDLAETWGRAFVGSLGERFVYAADEMFLLQGLEPPPVAYYDAFPQIENGIGMVRTFLDRWAAGRARLPAEVPRSLRLGLITGRLAAGFLRPIGAELGAIRGLSVDVLEVANDFFGHGITVSGLLTGQDILRRLQDGPGWDLVLLPPNCVNGDGVTLDDFTVPGLAEAARTTLAVGDYDLASCIAGCLDGTWAAVTGAGRQLDELGYRLERSRSS